MTPLDHANDIVELTNVDRGQRWTLWLKPGDKDSALFIREFAGDERLAESLRKGAVRTVAAILELGAQLERERMIETT